MYYERSGLIIFLSLFIGFMACGPGAAHAQATPVIHENPAGLTTQQPFDVNGKLISRLELMFGSLEQVAVDINTSQFDLSRLSLEDFDQYYQFFKDYLDRTDIAGLDYRQITGQADVTAEQLSGIIDSSDRFNTSFARFKAYYDGGDMVNATSTALELQEQYDAINSSSRELTLTMAALIDQLQNTGVDVDRLDEGINVLNGYVDRINRLNALPTGLLGHTGLTLEADRYNVSTGDVVAFTARLTANDTAVAGGVVGLDVDGLPAGQATTGSDGACTVSYRITPATFNGTIHAVARFDPQASSFTPAVSNGITLYRLPITTNLTMTVSPETARFGDTVRVEGRLTAGGGYPVPGHLISVNYGRQPVCYALTDSNGYYSRGINITALMPAGLFEAAASFAADSAPGEALMNAASRTSPVQVLADGTRLTLRQPPSAVDGGQNVTFAGTLVSASGCPVDDADVGIYSGGRLVASGTTDDRGFYRATGNVAFGEDAGAHTIYAAYRPGAGLSLTGSQSDGYNVTYRPITPAITVSGVPLLAFQGERVTLAGRVTAPDGTGIKGLALTARTPDATLGRAVTGDDGTFRLQYRVSLPAGSQAITVDADPDHLLRPAPAGAGNMYVLPIDLLTCLVIVAIFLLAAGLTIGRITRADRVIGRLLARPGSRDRRPAVTPLPGPPAGRGIRPEPARFEDEVARINGLIAGGADYREAIVEIYLAARRIAGARGFAVPESSTHREFFKKLVAQEPRLNVSAGTITRHYETAAFDRRQLSDKDLVDSLYRLKEINALIDDRPPGGGA